MAFNLAVIEAIGVALHLRLPRMMMPSACALRGERIFFDALFGLVAILRVADDPDKSSMRLVASSRPRNFRAGFRLPEQKAGPPQNHIARCSM
jgi:hypothetical protein